MDTSTTEIARAVAIADERRGQRGRRLLWITISGFVLVLLLSPALVWWAWQNRGRAMLRSEMDAIARRHEPLTMSEMNAWRADKQAGQRDITEIWTAALSPFNWSNVQGQETLTVSDNRDNITGAYWSGNWPKEAAATAFWHKWKSNLERVEAATKEVGIVNFDDHNAAFRQAWNARFVLHLQRTIHMRSGQIDAAIEDTFRMRALLDPLKDDLRWRNWGYSQAPVHQVCGMLNQSYNDCSEYVYLASRFPLTDEQLIRLQQLVQTPYQTDDLRDVLIAIRSDCLHWSPEKPTPEQLQQRAVEPPAEERMLDYVAQAAAPRLALTLRLMADSIAAASKPLPDALAEIQSMSSDATQLRDANAIDGFRYQQVSEQGEGLTTLVFNIGRMEARREMTNALLAAKRYQLKHGKLPERIDLLVPEFLPAVPVDPHGGGPIHYRLDEQTLTMWSIGIDLVDDGGINVTSGFQDIVLTIPLRPSPEK